MAGIPTTKHFTNKGSDNAISSEEVKVAISKMRNKKATELNVISIELWEKLGKSGVAYGR